MGVFLKDYVLTLTFILAHCLNNPYRSGKVNFRSKSFFFFESPR